MSDDERDRVEGRRVVRGILVAIAGGLVVWAVVGLVWWLTR